jgi:hypothetical protein
MNERFLRHLISVIQEQRYAMQGGFFIDGQAYMDLVDLQHRYAWLIVVVPEAKDIDWLHCTVCHGFGNGDFHIPGCEHVERQVADYVNSAALVNA